MYNIFYLSTLNTTRTINGAEDADHFEVAIIMVCHGVPVIRVFSLVFVSPRGIKQNVEINLGFFTTWNNSPKGVCVGCADESNTQITTRTKRKLVHSVLENK